MNKNQAKQMRVLVVDELVRAKGYLKYSLEELGFRDIEYVDQTAHAFTAIQRQFYNLVICAYDLSQEQEGYFFYEQLKQQHVLPIGTAFVFISADTAADVVHSIVELQPDEFLAKPFTVRDLGRRITRVLQRKQALAGVYALMGKDQFPEALSEVETFLTEPANAEWFPIALKTKGDLLMACENVMQAREFYQAILNVQNFTWAQLGLIKCLIHLNDDEDAERLILELAFKPGATLAACDLLSALQIKQQAYEDALECVRTASEISPRNILRHRQAMDLARLTHDYEAQFDAAKKIVRYAKHSIHDTPDNYLNVARAGVDFAMTADDAQADTLIRQAMDYLRHMEATFPHADVEDQMTVIDARIMYLHDEVDNAKQLLGQLDEENWQSESDEALLDRAKALHDVGLREHALRLLEVIEDRCVEDQGRTLFSHYIQQEKSEKIDIVLSPKALNNAAVQQFKQGELSKSLNTFSQAFRVMPKNPAIALNLLQATALNWRTLQDSGKASGKMFHRCLQTIEAAQLNDDQERRYDRVKSVLKDLA